jgi:small GTP-binding protein
VDFFDKIVLVGGKSARLQIWDTAGQERFSSLATTYLRNASVVVIAANLNDESAVEKTKTWIQVAKESTIEGTPFVICGTKADLEKKSNIQPSTFPMHLYTETCATTGRGVVKLFTAVGALALEDRAVEPVQDDSVDLVLDTTALEPPPHQYDACCIVA